MTSSHSFHSLEAKTHFLQFWTHTYGYGLNHVAHPGGGGILQYKVLRVYWNLCMGCAFKHVHLMYPRVLTTLCPTHIYIIQEVQLCVIIPSLMRWEIRYMLKKKGSRIYVTFLPLASYNISEKSYPYRLEQQISHPF